MWWLVRKPISEKTIVDNVLRWGTGGLNIDGCRIGMEGGTEKQNINKDSNKLFEGGRYNVGEIVDINMGRFPSNFTHDGSEEVMEEFDKAGISKSSDAIRNNNFTGINTIGLGLKKYSSKGHSDTGTPARFFYNTSNNCPKPYYKEKEIEDVWEKLQSLVSSVGLNSKITNQIKEFIALKNVVINQNKLSDQNVKNVEIPSMKHEIFIVALIVGLKENIITKSTLQVILDYITESKNCSLTLNLVNIAEIWGNIDTTQIIQIPSILYGYVNLVTIKFIQEIEKLELNQSTFNSMDTQLKNKQNCEIENKGRFIYIPKPSTKERNMGCDELEEKDCGSYAQDEWSRNNFGNTPDSKRKPIKNNHPTIKSVKLMAYLITLITPPQSTSIVLDPFMGSGSTGIAALLLDKKFIGIEREEEYIKIAEQRIKNFEKYRQFLK